jgi:hypothetical protein
MKKFIGRFSVLLIGIILFILGANTSEDIGPWFFLGGIFFTLLGLLVASRSSMLGYGRDMQLLNGIGTTLYGKSDVNPSDGTYVATKYFAFIFMPIVPLGSYRVRYVGAESKFMGTSNKYQMNEVPWHIKQIILTYLLSWGLLIAALVVLFSLA